MISNLSEKKTILLIFIIALFIRLFFSIYAYKTNVMKNFSDDLAYMSFATNVIEQGPFVTNIQKLDPSARVVGPGIAWIMAIIMLIFGKGWLPIFLINSIINSLTCVVIYLLAKQIFDKTIAFYSGMVSAFYVLYLKFIPTAGKEIWIIFLFVLLIYTLVKLFYVNQKKQIKFTIFLSLIFSLLIHVDERYFSYLPIILLFLFFSKKIEFSERLKRTFLFVILLSLLMIPWLYRNYKVYNRVIIISVRTAKFTEKLFGYSHIEYFKKHDKRWFISEAQIDSVKKYGKRVLLPTGRRISNEQVEAIRSGVLPHKFSKYETWLASLINLWEPIDIKNGYYETGYRFDGKWSLAHNLIQGFTYGILLIFSIFGIILFYKKEKKISILFLTIILYHTSIHIFLIPFTKNRYRLSIDFIIIIMGIYAITELYYKTLKQRGAH